MKKTTTRKLLAMLFAIVMFVSTLTGCGYDALGEELGVTNDDTQHQHENASGNIGNTVEPEDSDFQAQIDSINQQLAETIVAVETVTAENEALKLENEELKASAEKSAEEKATLEAKNAELENQLSDANAEKSILQALLEEYKVEEAKQLPWPYSDVEFDENGNPIRIKSMEAGEELVRIDYGNGLFVYRLGEGKKVVITDEINCMTGNYWDNKFDLAHKWGTIVGQTPDGALHYVNAALVKGDRFYSKDETTPKDGFTLVETSKKSSTYGNLPMDWSHAMRCYYDESAPGKVVFCLAYTESVYVKPAPKPVHCTECGHKDSCPDSCRCECCYEPTPTVIEIHCKKCGHKEGPCPESCKCECCPAPAVIEIHCKKCNHKEGPCPESCNCECCPAPAVIEIHCKKCGHKEGPCPESCNCECCEFIPVPYPVPGCPSKPSEPELPGDNNPPKEEEPKDPAEPPKDSEEESKDPTEEPKDPAEDPKAPEDSEEEYKDPCVDPEGSDKPIGDNNLPIGDNNIPVVDTPQDTPVVDTQDTPVVDTQDTSVIDTQDTPVVDTQDTPVVDTQDIPVVEFDPCATEDQIISDVQVESSVEVDAQDILNTEVSTEITTQDAETQEGTFDPCA